MKRYKDLLTEAAKNALHPSKVEIGDDVSFVHPRTKERVLGNVISKFNAVLTVRTAKSKMQIDLTKKGLDAKLVSREEDEPASKKDLEELSGKTLRSYSTKASDAKGHRKLSTKKVDNRYKGVAQASKKLSKLGEEDEPASPDEASMALDQAKFIGYVAEEVMEYIEGNNEFPEWMQNKLSALHEKAKGMHAVMAGKYESKKEYSKNGEEK